MAALQAAKQAAHRTAVALISDPLRTSYFSASLIAHVWFLVNMTEIRPLVELAYDSAPEKKNAFGPLLRGVYVRSMAAIVAKAPPKTPGAFFVRGGASEHHLCRVMSHGHACSVEAVVQAAV